MVIYVGRGSRKQQWTAQKVGKKQGFAALLHPMSAILPCAPGSAILNLSESMFGTLKKLFIFFLPFFRKAVRPHTGLAVPANCKGRISETRPTCPNVGQGAETTGPAPPPLAQSSILLSGKHPFFIVPLFISPLETRRPLSQTHKMNGINFCKLRASAAPRSARHLSFFMSWPNRSEIDFLPPSPRPAPSRPAPFPTCSFYYMDLAYLRDCARHRKRIFHRLVCLPAKKQRGSRFRLVPVRVTLQHCASTEALLAVNTRFLAVQ